MKYELFTTGEVRNFEELRSYVGRSEAVSVTDFTTGGLFLNDVTDLSTADDGIETIVDYKGRRWKRSNPLGGLVSVLRYGAVADGVTDDSGAFQRAIDSGNAIYVPEGTYKIAAKLTLATKTRIMGAGIDRAIINSNIVGDALFDADQDGASFIHISHLRLNGNNLTGASGSGHCFKFIDPNAATGSSTPQICRLEYLWIDGFMGTDDADENGVTKIQSAGVMMYGGLGNTMSHVYISDCGHGFYMRRTQNCRVVHCLATDIQKADVFVYDNENIVFDSCDFIDGGKSGGTTDSGYPVVDSDLAGVFVSYLNNNLTLQNSKLKGFQGKALIVLKGDGQNINIVRNWIRGDAQADQPHKAIFASRISNLNLTDNLFFPSNTGYSATRKYETIEIYTDSTSLLSDANVMRNGFLEASGFGVAYNIKVTGNAGTRLHRVTISDNRFGSNTSRASATTVDTDILIDTCTLEEGSFIGRNAHYAAGNVTRTTCYTLTSATNRGWVDPNGFNAVAGTITAEYTGMTESILTGSKTQDWADLATATEQSTTVTVTGAALGDLVDSVSMSVALSGTWLRGEVTAADTVTVYHRNDTGGNVNVASGTLRVKVQKA